MLGQAAIGRRPVAYNLSHRAAETQTLLHQPGGRMGSFEAACSTKKVWRAGTHQTLGQRNASDEARIQPTDCGIVPQFIAGT